MTLNGGTMLSSPDGANRVTVLNNLTVNNGTVTITDSCTACGLCVDVCRRGALAVAGAGT